jgi:hypothetical protein
MWSCFDARAAFLKVFHLGDGPLKGNRNLKCTYCTTHGLTCRYQESSQVRLSYLSVPDAKDQQAETGSVQEVRLASNHGINPY